MKTRASITASSIGLIFLFGGSTAAEAGSWKLKGAVMISPERLKADDKCYFARQINVTNGAAIGMQSWKNAGCDMAQGSRSACSGKYIGKVNWTAPPTELKPGTPLKITLTSNTRAENTCGSRAISSWFSLKGFDAYGFKLTVDDKKQTITTKWTIPKGSVKDKRLIEGVGAVAGHTFNIKYTYEYMP